MIAVQQSGPWNKRHIIPPLIFLVALFLIYPNRTVLFAPHWIIFSFSTASLSLFCAGACLFVPDRLRDLFRALPRWFKYAMLFFALIAGLHAAKNIATYSLAEIARSFSYLTIPLFACLYRDELKRLLPWAMALLWLLTLGQSFVERFMLNTDVLAGLPMNRNWNATLILITTPFAVLVTFRWADSIFKRFLFLLGIVLPSIYIFMICNSLAAYLALPGALFLFFLMNRKHWKIFLIAGMALLLTGSAAFFLSKTYLPAFRNFLEKEDRVVFYTAAVRMIADAPVSGYGIPSFEQEFIPYIRTPEYFQRTHAADKVNHPHNHLLFMAAGMGLAGLAMWLALWLVPVLLLTFRKEPDPEETVLDKLILFAWFVLSIHAMLDLVLFQEPTNILALVFTGWIWRRLFKPAATALETEGIRRTTLFRGCGYLLTGLALLMAACNLFSAVHFRMSHRLWLQGRQEESRKHIRQMLLTAHWDNTNYYLYQSAMRLPPKEALEVLDLIQASATPDFGRIHLLRGQLLTQLAGQAYQMQQPEQAIFFRKAAREAFFRDGDLYPLNIEALYFLWLDALYDRNRIASQALASEINLRLKQRNLDAKIEDPFPEEPQNAEIVGPDKEKAMTHQSK